MSRAVGLHFALLALLCAGALGACYAAATSGLPPKETLTYGDTEILVERSERVTAQDLQLPFYRGATVRQSYSCRLTKKADGKLLSYFATAQLDSRDAPETVAKSYSAQMPGKPKAERVTDKQGTRLVLAVGSKEEVWTVTIVKTRAGSEITLTRVVKHTETLKLPDQTIMPPGGPGSGEPPGRGRPPSRPRRLPRGSESA